jgi:hypothetical protein
MKSKGFTSRKGIIYSRKGKCIKKKDIHIYVTIESQNT